MPPAALLPFFLKRRRWSGSYGEAASRPGVVPCESFSDRLRTAYGSGFLKVRGVNEALLPIVMFSNLQTR